MPNLRLGLEGYESPGGLRLRNPYLILEPRHKHLPSCHTSVNHTKGVALGMTKLSFKLSDSYAQQYETRFAANGRFDKLNARWLLLNQLNQSTPQTGQAAIPINYSTT